NQSFDKLLSMLSPAELVTASTLDFFSWGGPTLKWFISDNVSVEAQRKRVQNWTKTLEKITTRANGSLSQRLDIAAARASIMPLQPISAESTIKQTKELDDLRKEIEKLRDQHQLTSMLPKLADSYASVGDGAKAIALLERAAAKSAVPYYFYGHIASLLEQAGEPEKSVVMRERAMRAARGTATKIQWTWNYLKSAEKSGLMDKDRRVETAAIELVKRNIEAKDGFLGRNRRYLDKASEVINRIPKKTKKLVLALEGYQKDCLSFQDPDRLAGCRSFFEKLSLKDAPPVPAESIK
ncbi:MAG: hypothetical protein NTV34_15925, partial [Proteobacteria bacterium]|nr:hypothetical protein [Pseudomonadota bacterium]